LSLAGEKKGDCPLVSNTRGSKKSGELIADKKTKREVLLNLGEQGAVVLCATVTGGKRKKGKSCPARVDKNGLASLTLKRSLRQEGKTQIACRDGEKPISETEKKNNARMKSRGKNSISISLRQVERLKIFVVSCGACVCQKRDKSYPSQRNKLSQPVTGRRKGLFGSLWEEETHARSAREKKVCGRESARLNIVLRKGRGEILEHIERKGSPLADAEEND